MIPPERRLATFVAGDVVRFEVPRTVNTKSAPNGHYTLVPGGTIATILAGPFYPGTFTGLYVVLIPVFGLVTVFFACESTDYYSARRY